MRELKSIRDPDSGQFLRTFQANGTKYVIRTLEEGIGIERFSMMRKMEAVVGSGSTFADLVNDFELAEQYYNSLTTQEPKLLELGVLLNNTKRRVVETSQNRYNIALWYCTLFICWEDEDMTKWVEADQQKKIDDWNKEGIKELDFLQLALSTVENFTNVYLRFYQQMKERKEELDLVTTA